MLRKNIEKIRNIKHNEKEKYVLFVKKRDLESLKKANPIINKQEYRYIFGIEFIENKENNKTYLMKFNNKAQKKEFLANKLNT